MAQPGSTRFWIANAAVWAAYGAVSVVMARAFAGSEGSSGFTLISLALAALLFAASGVLRARALARGWLEREPAAMAWRLLLAVAVLALGVQAGVAMALQSALRLGWVALPYSTAPYSPGAAFGYWINTVIILGLWTAAWAGWRLVGRARRSEVATLRALSERHALELDALRARLNPHFVFNALNNLRALILEDPERARELVTRLSSTLRHALEHSQRDWTTLGEEVAVVSDYLAVEQVHYEERLQARIAVPAALHGARLPPMALQLLVENAIKHGVARTAGGGELSIEAAMKDARLVLRVSNPGCITDTSGGTGVGLAFLRHRLDGIGGRFSLEPDAGRVVATLEIPQ
jgi:signal transduction histidine kinase